MLQNGQKQNTIDPAKTLQGEAGVFELISPGGEHFKVECRSQASICSLVSTEYPTQNWEVTKIADLPQSVHAGEFEEGRPRTRAAGAGSRS